VKGKLGAVLYSKEQIEQRLDELADEIMARFAGRELTVVAVLKGSLIFCSDLVRRLDMPVRVDILQVGSYFDGMTPRGEPVLSQYLVRDVVGRDVLIVDDIIETGGTLRKVVEVLGREKPASISVCVFLDKTLGRDPGVEPEFRGFVMKEDAFVVGYGLDYRQRYRNLPHLAALERPGEKKPARRSKKTSTARKKKSARRKGTARRKKTRRRRKRS